MSVSLTSDVHWINECYRRADGSHEHVSVYLIRDDTGAILVDSGSFYHREAIRETIDRTLGDQSLDAIILSHSDYPHSANITSFRDEWADVELIASSGSPEQQGLSDAIKADIGGSLDVCGRTIDFIDPPLADRSHTTWIFDRDAELLFTADGFGSTHRDGTCDWTSQEFADGIDYEDILRHNRETFVWLRYVDPEKLRRAVYSILDDYDPGWIAPIHGHPIHRSDREEYVTHLVSAADQIEREYSVRER